ncbi:MAG: 16S rRNA (guanine(527)-N(7))-methyltransferase RsmG [Gammaproteobacteria bacterium]|nr:MAG: 16S rRNA (guanine(527)-N(7))-methyltransferase RsmG [Gammaproteobacteria bacterium]
MMNQLLTQALKENHLTLSADAQEKLIHYLKLIQIWNRVFNLTTITQPREMVYLHLIDSLIITPYLHGQRFLDVGSGAGLPGIPLAIAHPHQQWVLLDKTNKKTRFLTQVIAELGLSNVEAVHCRAEDFHPNACFDSILSRAFGTLSLFTESTAHLLCAEGKFIAMKGKYPEEELQALSDRFRVEQVVRLPLQGIQAERHVVCMGNMK